VENAAIHTEINNLNSQVDILRSENVRMQTEIESKSALKSVEDYAENVLGMQKLDKSQIEYLSIENGNVVDIPESNENIFVKIKNAFENFVEYIRG
jgi:3-oxoacyl-[acyl-carrier-protein] synthase III